MMNYLSPSIRRAARRHANSSQMDDVLPQLASHAAGQHSSRIVIASVGSIDGSTEIAANLAARSAARGFRTLAIDANLHEPTMHHFFAVANERGLSRLLGSRDAPNRLLQPTSIPNLTVLPAGPSIGDGLSLLTTEDIFHRVSPMGNKFDCVIVDCTRLPAAVIATVAKSADSILIIAEQNATSLRTMSEFIDLLREKETVEPSVVLVHA
jgi:Mrp family chromosome partitioning ATPase